MINYKISLIVPFYNRGHIIDPLINSILAQTYENFEIIIVDDGSTTNLYDKTKFDDKRISFYDKPHTGPGLTRKYGLNKASGDLVFFIDSDDKLPNNNCLENIVTYFNQYNPDILFFDRLDFDNDVIEDIHSFNNISEGFHTISELTERIVPGLGCKIFRREKFNNDMFIEASKNEDLYTSYKYLNNCKNFYYTHKCFYYIYHDDKENSLSLDKKNETTKVLNYTIDILIKVYNEVDNKYIKKCVASAMPDIYIHYFLNRKNCEFDDEEYKKKVYKIVCYTVKEKVKYPFEDKNIIKMIGYKVITRYLLIKLKKYSK